MFSKIVLSLVTLSSVPAMAQTSSMWGTGVWGGSQGCAYQKTAGAGAQSENDDLKEIQQGIQEMQKQRTQKKTELSRLEKREMKQSENTIRDVLSSDYADFVIDHINVGRACAEYKGVGQAGDVVANGTDGGTAVQAPGTEETGPFGATEWGQVCDASKPGSVSGSVCTVKKYRNEDKGTSTVEDCKKSLSEYRKQKLQKDKLGREIAALDRNIKLEKQRLSDAKEDAAQAKKDGLSSPGGGGPSDSTEGGVCVNCIASGNGYTYQKPQTDWANVISNVGTGLLATYIGYKSQQMVTESNANLGWPTQSYPSWGYGLPYFAQGLYGAMGGGTGQGSFGCGGNGNSAGGAFGYPQSMMGMNTAGGGIYAGGMGPWGMNGMNALGGMGGYGMGGYMMGSMMGYGNMMGSMIGMGGIMNAGMMMGDMMGGYGSMTGSMMGYGNMMGSMMGMGGIMNAGMMMGNMMGGYGSMTGSMMGYGNMMGSMMGMGGIMNAGMMMGNMTGGYGSMTGSMMGGLMSSGMMMGNMMGYGTMTGSLIGNSNMSQLNLQYQQQAMQMQMQYYQQYQQQQQQKYQAVSSLQQEIYSLMYRMQSLQYGYGTTGYIGSSTSTGGLTSTGYTTYPVGGLLSSGYTTYGSAAPSSIPVTTGTTTTTTTSGR